jgi:hypothetical protein
MMKFYQNLGYLNVSKIFLNQIRLESSFKLAFIIVFMLAFTGAFAQPYNAPYEIPRFKAFLDECKFQAPTSSTAATNASLTHPTNPYTSSYFYVADGDKMAFNQSGDLNRSELRYETNWDLTQQDRSLHARINIVQQTVECEQVTVLQIHDDANAGTGPNKPLLRVYKHQTKSPINHLWAAYKTDAGGANTSHIDLGLAPAGYFNCDVRLVNGNMIIDVDGVEKANVDVSFWTFPSYWKAGVYLQDPGEATAYFDQLFTGDGSVLSTKDLKIDNIKIYPNPFNDKVKIENASSIQTLVLYNMLGKEVYKTSSVSGFESFSGILNSGVYVLKLVDKQDKIIIKRVIKN